MPQDNPERGPDRRRRGTNGEKSEEAAQPEKELLRRRRIHGRATGTGTRQRMMEKRTITVKIMGRPYSFTIDSEEKEELYHAAEREVNNALVTMHRKNYQGWTETDYLGLIAFRFAADNREMRQQREVKSDELKKLEALDAEIDAYLHTL